MGFQRSCLRGRGYRGSVSFSRLQQTNPIVQPGAMERRRAVRAREGGSNDPVIGERDSEVREAPALELRKPRHGGWKGKEPSKGEQMLRGEPGYRLGLFRVAYGVLLVQRTLTFMTSGAVDASFSQGDTNPSSPDGGQPTPPQSVFNFGHGFLLLSSLGSPSADAVRSACWCLCAAGVALSVGYRSNAVAFAASILQLCLLLLEKSLYTDEAYLFACVGLVLCFTDCGKTLAVEASPPSALEGDGQRAVGLRNQPPDTVPHWHAVLVRFQICIVHIHRGLAKAATPDWLFGGQPLLHTLEAMPSNSLVRRAAEWAASSGLPGFGGGGLKALTVRANGTMIFLDLFEGVSLLAAPHYRPAALALQTAIHLSFAALGPSHARPWHLLVACSGVLFADPASVRDMVERARAWLQPGVSYDGDGRRVLNSVIGHGRRGHQHRYNASLRDIGDTVVEAAPQNQAQGKAQAKKLPLQPKPSPATLALVSLFVLAQALLPLRHLLGVFPVEWSREGHEFSWRLGVGVGVGGRGGGGELVQEEALVRVTHRPRVVGNMKAGRGGGVQMVHLYGALLTAQQVLRMVVDPDMLLQLAKRSAETSPAADGGQGTRSSGDKKLRAPPISSVDAWKSINGRPFIRWIDPSVDVWDADFGGEGPSNAEWLEMPPLDEELDMASAVMEAVRTKWAMRDQRVTFFAAREGQAGLSNVFLGRYDPTNFNTTELCAVSPLPPPAAASDNASPEDIKTPGEAAGGILFGVAHGEVQLLTEPEDGKHAKPETVSLTVSMGAIPAPVGRAHSVRPSSSVSVAGRRRGGRGALAVWYYVHKCPDGLFHLCAGFLSGAGWQQLYPPHMGARKGWTMQHGVPKR